MCADLAAVAGRPLVDGVAGRAGDAGARRVDGGAAGDAGGRGPRRRRPAGARSRRPALPPALLGLRARARPTTSRARAAAPVGAVDDARLRAAVAALLPTDVAAPAPDWQRVAAVTAVLRRLCVISGGPGTGKTSTVVRLLGLLAAPRRRRPAAGGAGGADGQGGGAPGGGGPRPGCGLLPAPLRHAIPEHASTVHRLLGVHRDSPRVTYGSARPLSADVVVVDEASMVDLALMAKLLRALRPEARLVLLGDKDQLASVEAGAVLGDVCGDAPGFSPAFAARVAQRRRGVRAGRHGRRRLAAARRGRAAARTAGASRRRAGSRGWRPRSTAATATAPSRCSASGPADVGWRPHAGRRAWRDALAAAAARRVRAVPRVRPRRCAGRRGARRPSTAFRILCAHRAGPAGVEVVNRVRRGRPRGAAPLHPAAHRSVVRRAAR